MLARAVKEPGYSGAKRKLSLGHPDEPWCSLSLPAHSTDTWVPSGIPPPGSIAGLRSTLAQLKSPAPVPSPWGRRILKPPRWYQPLGWPTQLRCCDRLHRFRRSEMHDTYRQEQWLSPLMVGLYSELTYSGTFPIL